MFLQLYGCEKLIESFARIKFTKMIYVNPSERSKLTDMISSKLRRLFCCIHTALI